MKVRENKGKYEYLKKKKKKKKGGRKRKQLGN